MTSWIQQRRNLTLKEICILQTRELLNRQIECLPQKLKHLRDCVLRYYINPSPMRYKCALFDYCLDEIIREGTLEELCWFIGLYDLAKMKILGMTIKRCIFHKKYDFAALLQQN